MSEKPYGKPLPMPDLETQPFWDGARAGRLRLPKCNDCGQYHFLPRALCPHCRSENWTWVDASGDGVIYSFTIAHRGAGPAFKDDAPYAIAIIELAEGPRMMSNIVTDDLSRIAVDGAVRVTFDAVTDDITLPKFTLVEAA
ncbi:MAG: Zn-ribbon domain-containing OB-fold protein [Alphaproteobacteria bacterium]|nr:Zn-ribbon domain-containing OB-fold protein [Alphaproteobacteria bacterium]MBL6953092.1 Zn-ribbon domain-containing OB-fold protein [Alphaproteobacteria bacterium]